MTGPEVSDLFRQSFGIIRSSFCDNVQQLSESFISIGKISDLFHFSIGIMDRVDCHVKVQCWFLN